MNRWYPLIRAVQAHQLVDRIRVRHGGSYTLRTLVDDLLRTGDKPVPILTDPGQTLTGCGWVTKLQLDMHDGSIDAEVRGLTGDRIFELLDAGAELSAAVAFEYARPSDGEKRAAFLTEVLIQPAPRVERQGMAINPCNQKVESVRYKRELSESGIVDNAHGRQAETAARVEALEFVATMSHADVLTAQRMAKAALGL